MDKFPVNYTAIFAAGVVGFVAMAFQYTYFGKQWSEMMGFTKVQQAKMQKEMDMTKAMGISFALTLAQAWVVAHSYLFASSYALMPAEFTRDSHILATAFFCWVGYKLPIHFNHYLWEGKPLNLVVFNGVGSLAVLLIQLAIIGRWPGN